MKITSDFGDLDGPQALKYQSLEVYAQYMWLEMQSHVHLV